MMKYTLPFVLCGALASCASTSSVEQQDFAWQKLNQLTGEVNGIGARPAGTAKEQEAADWIKAQWQAQGHKVKEFRFEAKVKGQAVPSSNLSITLPGKSEQILIIGAHFDSTGEERGSLGAIDNGSGVAAIIDLARRLANKSLPYTLRLVAFGAEEHGLQGSYAYVNDKHESLANVIGMINLDTIIGGDKLYVHSANVHPYDCKKIENPNYLATAKLRDGLINVSQSLFGDEAHALHPPYRGYPAGQTGSWSDHAPFACSGIPIAYLEATNFGIKGRSGNDGYSQTEHPDVWDCFKEQGKTACNRFTEKKWGMIWHTQFDRLDKLNAMFGGRLKSQLEQNVDVLESYVLNLDQHL